MEHHELREYSSDSDEYPIETDDDDNIRRTSDLFLDMDDIRLDDEIHNYMATMKQAEIETQTSLSISPTREDFTDKYLSSLPPLFTINRVVHLRGRPKRTKKHTQFYKKNLRGKPTDKFKAKGLQQRPLSTRIAEILMDNNDESTGSSTTSAQASIETTTITESFITTATTVAAESLITTIIGAVTTPITSTVSHKCSPADNDTLTASQDSVTSNSSNTVSRSLAVAVLSTMSFILPLPSSSFFTNSVISVDDLRSTTNTNIDSSPARQHQLPVINNNSNSRKDEDKENTCMIVDTIINEALEFNPPNKEYVLQVLNDTKLITRDNTATLTLPTFGL
ncbi:unnamed protein product [Didymodactylos carnosus]|uniref:Uncharacterized protein n=1 Tax=Didymodactylos carnosus TaxID=1234261 RepID=A0A8S2EMU4_9BILA|nr:unnamed protein product [Didymodactylos carnosus]CAF4023038.1 unnamed protein product [Didymodactylos carnosus]